MAKKKSAIAITAAAMPPVSPAIAAGGGIRSAPTQNLWRSWRSETAALAAERVQKSRFLQEALPFIDYLVTQLPEEAIGDGLVPTSDSKNPNFKRESTARFDLWANSTAIDIRRRFKFYSSQHLVGKTMIGDGELFVLKVRDDRPEALARPLTDTSFRRLQLQFLTRDQLGNSGNRDYVANGSDLVWDAGVQFDKLDIARAYRILTQPVSTSLSSQPKAGFDQVPASQMLHIFADRHFNQRHGTPWLFNGQNSLFDSIDLHAVEKYANKIRAYFLGAITTPTGATPASVRPQGRKGTDADGNDDGLRTIELAGGIAIPVFKQGESISFFNGQSALSFAEIIQRCWNEAVYCLKFPPEYLINVSGLGSASVRMVLRKVKKALDRIRRPVREQYCQAVWEFVIGDAIERGEPWTKDEKGNIVEDWRMVTWKGGVDPSIDAGRDERAEQEKLRTFTGTVEQYCDALGLDGETIRHARIDEIADNIAHGAKRGLPWFMCIDAMQVQAMTGLATSLGVDVADLVKQISAASEK